MSAIRSVDLVIVGAGPGGMAAARRAVGAGLSTVVLDSQSQPGGQIWRNARSNARSPIVGVLGSEYRRGIQQVQSFLSSGAEYLPDAQVSRLLQGWTVEYVREDAIHFINGKYLLLATGAQERPVPFPGWTLPGVMTVGAAQILLKAAGQLPQGPVVVAGNGPLPLLYLHQMRTAGLIAAAYLDTTPRGVVMRAISGAAGAIANLGPVLKGVAWLPSFNSIPHVKGVTGIVAKGVNRLEIVEVERAGGKVIQMEARTLLVHEGLVPNHHLAASAGARLAWDEEQSAFHLERDEWMNAGPAGLYLAGDTARIGGARNAEIEGEIAAIGILLQSGKLTLAEANAGAVSLRRMYARQKLFRSFLDGIYPPHLALKRPDDATILCRCENLKAGELREVAVQTGCKGPNQLKTFTRAGMGPCQGRQCGYPVHELVKSVGGLPADKVGLYYPRPPFVPVTVSMLAQMETDQIVEQYY